MPRPYFPNSFPIRMKIIGLNSLSFFANKTLKGLLKIFQLGANNMVTMNLMDPMEKTELMGPMDLTVLGGFNAALKTEAAEAAEVTEVVLEGHANQFPT